MILRERVLTRPAVLVLVLAVLGLGAVVIARLLVREPTPDRRPWQLVWSDEFAGSSLDRSNWNAENESSYGDGNQELACLMDRPQNLTVSGGLLRLTARRERSPLSCGRADRRFPSGRGFSSAHLTTKTLHEWKYGRFEIRARTPTPNGTSAGLWPAFWLRPTGGGTGELDVLEAIGGGAGDKDWNKVVQTIWYDYTGTHKKQAKSYTFPSGGPADGMHTYAAEWDPGQIRWYVDGVETFARTAKSTSWLDEAFSKPFYLRLNLAVGGTWPGSPDGSTTFPASYEIDYVRVFQRK